MSTTWNPSDKGSGIVLSGGNKIATGASGNNKVRGTTSHVTSGKYYLEYPSNSVTAGSGIIGFGLASVGLNDNTVTDCVGVDPGGNFKSDSEGHATGLTPNGKHLSFAVDFTNGKIWMRFDGGVWFGNSVGTPDPVTNTNGLPLSETLALFPLTFIQNVGNNTINAGDTAFTYAIPSGFIAWDSTPPPQRFQATAIF
jgi:hypothetical protein